MYKTIDLFAGAGGLSLGFQQTGRFRLLAAAEINPNARATYNENIPRAEDPFEFIENVVDFDFAALSDRLGGIDVVIGGPPCQGFSNANRQKNHLISMNNALVKEYFRAIREIRPIAFVMENVSMLESDTHRFYDSHKDHDDIERLKDEGHEIPTRTDSIFISLDDFPGFNMLDIARSINTTDKLLLPNKLNELIRILNKHRNNEDRCKKFLEKNRAQLIRLINGYVDGLGISDGQTIQIVRLLEEVKQAGTSNETIKACDALSTIVEIQKNLTAIKEIYQNELIGDFKRDANGSVIFDTKSYSVIDYVNAILGNGYVQKGATLNAEWFGVPQERRRHIIVGIRNDFHRNGEVQFPDTSVANCHYTVQDAIMDLVEYKAGHESDCEDILYHEQHELSEYALEMRCGSVSVKNHFTTKTTPEAMKRFKVIKQGKNFHSLDKSLKTTYTKPERTQNTIYWRLDPNAPSGTVVNVRKSMWIHPTLDRAVTVREAARLQSFPDSFKFVGTKDSQYQQVGNAVPPKLARGIAEMLLRVLDE